ncbi:MAG: EAL domain-containing protein [Steroidobacteraceae bacterium]
MVSATTESGAPGLAPYAQMLRALLPRATSIAVFSGQGEALWTDDGAVGPDIAQLASESLQLAARTPDQIGQLIQAAQSEPVYLFWLRRDGAEPQPFALVAVGCRLQGEGGARPFDVVQSMLRPALECLRRELLAREEIQQLNAALKTHGRDLDMLLSVSDTQSGAEASSQDELRQILQNAAEHLKSGLVALLVPERSVALMQVSRTQPMDTALLAKAHRHLLSLAQMRREAVIVNHMKAVTAQGEILHRILSCPILRSDGRPMGVLALFRAIEEPEFTPHHARLSELLGRRIATIIASSYDTLTGLYARTAFEQQVKQTLAAPQAAPRAWSALVIDMNRMHLINDNYGMHVGDRVLAGTGELLRSRLPPGGLVGRISGDRFGLLLPATLNDAAAFAESLRQGAEQIGRSIGDGHLQVSISVGVASLEARTRDYKHAYAAAETACKAANDRGRNRVEIYQPGDESIVRRFTDINVAENLRSALTDGRLRLYAQLIAPLAGHGAPHFELLLRMLDETGEVVGPNSFLSAAQRYQMMPEIDQWVVGEALRQLRPYAGLLQQHPAVFTINCSGQSLTGDGFTDFLCERLQESALNPAAICVELTESAAIGHLDHAESMMRRLRALGCNIALDDFGTGLSSLAYLRSLPIGMLKIDGSFVRDVLVDPRADSMVQTITQLAHSLRLETVAEYVETDAIRNRVRALGVDYGQGFAIAAPQPLPDLLGELPLYLAAAHPGGIWEGQVA